MINGGRVDAGSICLTGVDMQKGFSRRRNLDPTKCKKGFEDEEISIQLNVKKGFKRTENLKNPMKSPCLKNYHPLFIRSINYTT